MCQGRVRDRVSGSWALSYDCQIAARPLHCADPRGHDTCMLKRHVARACCLGLLILAGCGDDSAGPTTPVDVSGKWNSSGTDANGSGFTFILTLTQTGTIVTGTGQILNVATGTI